MHDYRTDSLPSTTADSVAGKRQRAEILILTASTGAGHNSVAAALREALNKIAPDLRVRVHDVLAGTKPCLPDWYDATVEYAPWLWRLFYRTTNRDCAVRLGTGTARPWEHRLRATLGAMQPGLVISVHPICTQLAAAILRNAQHRPPLHCVVTDLATVHQSWASEQVRQYYVATSDAARSVDGPRHRSGEGPGDGPSLTSCVRSCGTRSPYERPSPRPAPGGWAAVAATRGRGV